MENYNMVLWQHFKCWRSNIKKIHINSLKLLNSLFPFGRSLMLLLIPLSGRHVRKKKKKSEGVGRLLSIFSCMLLVLFSCTVCSPLPLAEKSGLWGHGLPWHCCWEGFSPSTFLVPAWFGLNSLFHIDPCMLNLFQPCASPAVLKFYLVLLKILGRTFWHCW